MRERIINKPWNYWDPKTKAIIIALIISAILCSIELISVHVGVTLIITAPFMQHIFMSLKDYGNNKKKAVVSVITNLLFTAIIFYIFLWI